jgi:hypothetical protein
VANGGPYSGTTDFTKTTGDTYTATGVALNCATGGGSGTASGTSKITLASGSQYQIDNSALVPAATCPPEQFTASFTVGAPVTTSATGTATAGTCDQGSVSWIMCPILNNITNSVAGLAKSVLVPLLQVNHISPTSTPSLYQSWKHIRDFADVLFILIFLVIIIGTVTEQDIGALSRYHIKTIWPRLIIAAILVQFSFFFSGVIIDIGNVLGAGIQELIIGITGPTASADPANVVGTIVVGGVGVLAGAGAIAVLATWTVAFPLVLSLMLSLLVAFLTLGARFLIIAVLVVLSPLAMVAWVLPNTEHLFNSWAKILFRLVMMYPIIIGVISLAGLVSQILPFSGDTAQSGVAQAAVAIIKPLIAIAAFLIIPAAFRWSGQGMAQVTNMLNRAGARGQGALKSSSMWERGAEERQRRQAGRMKSWMNTRGMTRLESGGMLGRGTATVLNHGAGLAMMNAPKDKASLARMRSKLTANAMKELEQMDEASIGNLQKVDGAFGGTDLAERKKNRKALREDAPNLFKLAATPTGRVAVAKRLGDLGFANTDTAQSYADAAKRHNILSMSNNTKSEYADVLKAIGKETGSKPGVVGRVTGAKSDYGVKDAGGNKVKTISRNAGDLDLNAVSKSIRRVNARDFGDKHSIENFKVMGKRGDSNASLDLAAEEMAGLYAENMNRVALAKAMDSTDPRSPTSLEARIEWLKNIQMNADVFKAKNPDILKISAANLESDQDLTNNMLKVMGIDGASGVKVLSAAGRAHVVRDWMHDEAYDPYHDYESSGKVIV